MVFELSAEADGACGPVSAEPVNKTVYQLPLTVKINLVEPLGDRIDVFLSTQHHPLLVARMDARAGWLPGTSRTVYLDPDRMHFFEPDEEATGRSGANLCLDAEKRRG